MMAFSATTDGYRADMAQVIMLAHASKNGLGMSKHCSQLNGSPTTVPATQQEKQ
jgi:hypothetical protein